MDIAVLPLDFGGWTHHEWRKLISVFLEWFAALRTVVWNNS